MADAQFELSIKVYPTEDAERIASGVRKIFPDVELKLSENMLSGSSNDIEEFINNLARHHIRDTARDIILNQRDEKKAQFVLNKQAATSGKISFIDQDESSLGGIEVALYLNDWDWLEEKLSPPILKDPKWDEE